MQLPSRSGDPDWLWLLSRSSTPSRSSGPSRDWQTPCLGVLEDVSLPPRITKRTDSREEIRVCVRDRSQPERERIIGWSEPVDEPSDPEVQLFSAWTPWPLGLGNAGRFSIRLQQVWSDDAVTIVIPNKLYRATDNRHMRHMDMSLSPD
ncbi:hypothetical protein CPLU01_02618 [Colletotrichum plurivorum]|uniref:Uncharacterized protein n=1 Tax=Colletotrichum plurivorum TaxID=2175906 RepID=A0A8H6KV66_9PEZI|nr:hypothetical protein CPLU01_02618 [Colletotrichum plurivorum]